MRESETFASVYVLLGPGRRRALDELMPLINDRLGVSARVEYKERMRRNESPGGPPP